MGGVFQGAVGRQICGVRCSWGLEMWSGRSGRWSGLRYPLPLSSSSLSAGPVAHLSTREEEKGEGGGGRGGRGRGGGRERKEEEGEGGGGGEGGEGMAVHAIKF